MTSSPTLKNILYMPKDVEYNQSRFTIVMKITGTQEEKFFKYLGKFKENENENEMSKDKKNYENNLESEKIVPKTITDKQTIIEYLKSEKNLSEEAIKAAREFEGHMELDKNYDYDDYYF
jgi:UDP-N-acetylglucosamine 2-epimerase